MNEKCIFCQPEREIIIERGSCFAIYDKFPVSKGHMLIIPYYRHESGIFKRAIPPVGFSSTAIKPNALSIAIRK